MNTLFLNTFAACPQATAGLFGALTSEEVIPKPVQIELLGHALRGAFSRERDMDDMFGRFGKLETAVTPPDINLEKVRKALKELERGIAKLDPRVREALRKRADALSTYDTERGLEAYRVKLGFPTRLSADVRSFDFVPAEFKPIQTTDDLLTFQRTFGVALIENTEILSGMGLQFFREECRRGQTAFQAVDVEVVWPAVPGALRDHVGVIVDAGAASAGILFDNVDAVGGISSNTGLWARMEGARFLYATDWTATRNAYLQVAQLTNGIKATEVPGETFPSLTLTLLQADYHASRRVSRLSIHIIERGMHGDQIRYPAKSLLRATYAEPQEPPI